MSASDERLSLSVLGDISSIDRALTRLDRSLGDVEDAFLSVASAAGVAEERVDAAGDEATESAGEFTALAGAIEVADAALSDFGDVDLDFDAFPTAGLVSGFQTLPDDIDTSIAALERLESTADRAGGETRYSIAVDRSDLEEAFDELPAQRVRVNPVLQSLQGELENVAPAAEDVEREVSESISTSRERSVAVETDNVEAAAVALGDLNRASEDVRTTFAELDGNDVRIGVDAENVDSTLAGLQSVGVAAEAIDGQESVISVDLDRSDYDPGALATLSDQSVVAEIDTEADTSGVTTTQGLLDTLAERETVSGIDTDVDLSSLSDVHDRLDAIPERVSSRLSLDTDTGVIDRYETRLNEIAEQYAARLVVDHDTEVLDAYQTRLDRFADRDIEVPIDTEVNLDGVVSAAAGINSLPDDPSVLIETESDLAGIVALSSALAALPDEHTTHVATDMDVPGTSAHIAALEGIEQQADETADELVETRRAAMGLGAVSLGSLGFASLPSLPDRLSTPSVPSPGPLDIGARFTGADTVDEAASQLASVSGDRQVDISLGDSERRILSDVRSINTALESLLTDETVAINTRADLDALVQSVDTFDELPREVRSELDVDAKTADAHAALSAVFAHAETVDDLTIDIDTDADTNALNVLSRGGDDFDFDFDAPDISDFVSDLGDGEERATGLRGAIEGMSALARGAGRGIPGVSGAIGATGGLGPAGIAGAGGLVAGLGSIVASAVSGGIGAALGGGLTLGAIAAPVYLSVDEREKTRLNQAVQAAIEPLRTNRIFESMSDTVLSDIPYVVSEIVSRVTDLDTVLQDTFQGLRGSFFENLPAILDSAEQSVRVLSDNLQSVGAGVFESLPGIIDTVVQSADTLLPILSGWMSSLGPIIGSMVSFGDALFQVLDAPVQAFLDILAAFTPVIDLISDGLMLAGNAMSFFYDNISSQSIDQFAWSIEYIVGMIRSLGEGIYNVGQAFGIWQGLADLITGAGEAIEGLVQTSITVYNRLNNLPGVPGQDLAVPEFAVDSGGEANTSAGPPMGGEPPTAPGVATIADSAVASLPSNTSAASSAGSGTTSTASTASTASAAGGTGGGGPGTGGAAMASAVNHYNYDVTVDADNTTTQEMRRVARDVHRQLQKMDRKRNGPSA